MVTHIEREQRNKRIAELLFQSKTIDEIGAEVRLTSMRVRQIANALGIEYEGKVKITLRKDQIKKRNEIVFTELNSGKTLEEIGKQFNLSRERVRQIALKKGLTKKDINNELNESRIRCVCTMIENGATREEMAEELNMSLDRFLCWANGKKIRFGNKKRKEELTTRIDSNGYIRVKVGRKWIMRTRWVMEQILGRKLKSTERIFHKNGNKQDDRFENLKLYKAPAGKGSTIVGGKVVIRVDDKYINRDRLVMEKIIGRKLRKWESIVHKDFNLLNDNPKNLILCKNSAEARTRIRILREKNEN